jgi:uncharacterized RDD family membrane protein YckC
MTSPYTSRRVGATLIDYTLIFALTFYYIFEFGTINENGGHEVSGLPALVPVAFWFVYFIITESYMDGTLGHHIFKLKVVPESGKKLTFGQVFLRRICDALEIAWCFGLIAYLLVRNSDHNQRLGDLVAKTRVIGKEDPFTEVVFDFEKK